MVRLIIIHPNVLFMISLPLALTVSADVTSLVLLVLVS
jgi:hypothetical protein